MSDLVARLRELEAKATPGPWFAAEYPAGGGVVAMMSDECLVDVVRSEDGEFIFIAVMRNTLPKLLDVVDAARAFCELETCDEHACDALVRAVDALNE